MGPINYPAIAVATVAALIFSALYYFLLHRKITALRETYVNDYEAARTKMTFNKLIAEMENTIEREIMTKARQLFDYPEPCNDRHRLPDLVEDFDLVVERTSYLIDKNDPNRPHLVYRRIYIKDGENETLDLNSQFIEYTEWNDSVPIEIVLPNNYPEAEIDADILNSKIGMLLDRHLSELSAPRND